MPSLLRPLVLLHSPPGAPATSGSWLRRRLANQRSDEFRNSLVSCWIAPSHFFSPRSQLLLFRLPGTFAANKLDNQQRNWRLLSHRLGTVKPATTSVANQFHVHKRPNTSQGNSNIFRHGKSCLSDLRGKGSGTSQTLASTTKKTHN